MFSILLGSLGAGVLFPGFRAPLSVVMGVTDYRAWMKLWMSAARQTGRIGVIRIGCGRVPAFTP